MSDHVLIAAALWERWGQDILLIAAIGGALVVISKWKPVRWVFRRNVTEPLGAWFKGLMSEAIVNSPVATAGAEAQISELAAQIVSVSAEVERVKQHGLEELTLEQLGEWHQRLRHVENELQKHTEWEEIKYAEIYEVMNHIRTEMSKLATNMAQIRTHQARTRVDDHRDQGEAT